MIVSNKNVIVLMSSHPLPLLHLFHQDLDSDKKTGENLILINAFHTELLPRPAYLTLINYETAEYKN